MEQINLSPEVYLSTSIDNDIPYQLKLPINLGIMIDSSDHVWTFNEVMEGVNLAQFLKVNRLGRESYNHS